MEIKNVNTNSSKNLQLVSTYGEKGQHAYVDLLDFKYSIDGEIFKVREIFEQIYTTDTSLTKVKKSVKTALESFNKVQDLVTKSLDLMDLRILEMEKELEDIKAQINILK